MKRLSGFLILILSTPQAYACSVCFGDPNSLQSKALTGAVTLLIGTIGVILAGIVWTAFIWARRAKKLANEASAQSSLS